MAKHHEQMTYIHYLSKTVVDSHDVENHALKVYLRRQF